MCVISKSSNTPALGCKCFYVTFFCELNLFFIVFRRVSLPKFASFFDWFFGYFSFLVCLSAPLKSTFKFKHWWKHFASQVNIGKFTQYVTPSDPLSTWANDTDRMLNCSQIIICIDKTGCNRISKLFHLCPYLSRSIHSRLLETMAFQRVPQLWCAQNNKHVANGNTTLVSDWWIRVNLMNSMSGCWILRTESYWNCCNHIWCTFHSNGFY